MNPLKILIGTPTHSSKNYAFAEWQYHVNKICYPSDLIEKLITHNDKTNSYGKYLQSFGFKVRHIRPEGKSIGYILADTHNAIRQYFLENDFDYLLHLESDIMIESQTLQTLLLHKKDIVGAIYFSDSGEHSRPIILQDEKYITPQAPHKKITWLDWKDSLNFCDGSIKRVFSIGLGCLLISRRVMEKIPFRYEPNKENAAPDVFFAEDCYKHNIPIFADTSIILKHENQDWNKNINYQLQKISER